MRMMIMVRQLNDERPGERYVLVMPPWGRLYHWQSRQLGEQVRDLIVSLLCHLTENVNMILGQDPVEGLFRHGRNLEIRARHRVGRFHR